MNEAHISKIALEINVKPTQVLAAAALLEQGGTVPFISRYRKEATGSLDEVAVTSIRDRLEQLAELDKRREAILKSLEERNLLTDELKTKINAAETMTVLEDIYLPFRPKRRTRATIAREKGLEPLAAAILEQNAEQPIDIMAIAATFIDLEKGVANIEEALAGARDIIAENVSEDQRAREAIRDLFMKKATIRTAVHKDKEEEAAKFKDYFAWEELAANAPSHRILAMRRGEKEKFLSLRVSPQEDDAVVLLNKLFVKGETPASAQVALAVEDGYKRLLSLSIETEIRIELKKHADTEAIRVFAENLRELLLTPPLGQKRVLALDPGFRTGCKAVCLDAQGKMIHHETFFPLTGEGRALEAVQSVKKMCDTFEIEIIAIGNGTASRETEAFVNAVDLGRKIPVVMVNESGASIYSASEVAREEFPDQDITVRGAVSIGRRLMDPLAELVKIDPKSIGVGQYQHDVDQPALRRSLDDVVISCVNAVGVDVNTSSKQLLTYVSGMGPQLAGNVVSFRNENGPFKTRAALKKVPRLGPKAFEQAAGFLRISSGKNPLDSSAVHPESYHIVDAMAADLDCSVSDLMRDDTLRKNLQLEKYVTDTVGMPTLNDIINELAKPGRDPREQFEAFSFAEGVNKIDDLVIGMKLPGIVTNVTAFGAFVDIGVHQDGLVHISQLADKFVRDPSEVVKVNQRVEATVMDVDIKRKRIALSLKKDPFKQPQQRDRSDDNRPPMRKKEKEIPKPPANRFMEALNRAKDKK